MPKDFPDLLQRSPMPQHANCQSVPELVGAAVRCIDPGSPSARRTIVPIASEPAVRPGSEPEIARTHADP